MIDPTPYRGQLGAPFFSGTNVYAAPNPYGGIFGSSPPFSSAPSNNNTAGNNSSIFTPTYNSGSSSSGGGNTVHYFDTIASVVSQAIAGWSKNSTNQVIGGSVVGNPGVLTAEANAQALQSTRTEYPNSSTPSAGSPGGIIDQFIEWAKANPIYVFLFLGGLYLLYKPSPGKR